MLPPVAALVLAVLCSGCGGARYAQWDGRRGYDGNGDYGYDLAAARSEASSYRSRAPRSYAAPGTPADPWGPYIRESATRFQVPDRWIRAVMRQESGGHLYDPDGSLMTSSAGAMGLMQVMPRTYDMLQQRYGLGSDPFEPRDNILAGTAYIREMYDRYGSPAFLAAYNAGPDRLEGYLSGRNALPDETVNYLASVAPSLGGEATMRGPLAVYAGGGTTARWRPQASVPDADRAYAGGGMSGQDYQSARVASARQASTLARADLADDPSARAFDGGGLVTPDAPTGNFSAPDPGPGLPAPVSMPERVVSASALALPSGGRAPELVPPTYPAPTYPAPTYPVPTYPAPTYRAASAAVPAPPVMSLPAAVPAGTHPPAAPARQYQPGAPARPYPASVPSRPYPEGVAPASRPAGGLAPAGASMAGGGGWGIQVGAYPDPAHSENAIATARVRGGELLASAHPTVMPVQRAGTLYRARLVGLSAARAAAACARLAGEGLDCFTVPPGS